MKVFGLLLNAFYIARWLNKPIEDQVMITTLSAGKFAGVDMPASVYKSLEKFGIHDSPSPIQAVAIPELCKGSSCILHAATGTGKTLAYSIPAIKAILSSKPKGRKPCQAMIVVPTRDLAQQVYENILMMTDNDASLVAFCNEAVSDSFLRPSAPIWIGTAYKLLQYVQADIDPQQEVSYVASHLQYLVLDEVDRLLPLQNRYLRKGSSSSYDTAAYPLSQHQHQPQPTGPLPQLVHSFQRLNKRLQVVPVSASVGRPLRRELSRLLSPITHDLRQEGGGEEGEGGEGDEEDETRGQPGQPVYGDNFPILRPVTAAIAPTKTPSTPATSSPSPSSSSSSSSSSRYVTIPPGIDHYLLLDPEDREVVEESYGSSNSHHRPAAGRPYPTRPLSSRPSSSSSPSSSPSSSIQQLAYRLKLLYGHYHRHRLVEEGDRGQPREQQGQPLQPQLQPQPQPQQQVKKALIFVPEATDRDTARAMLLRWGAGQQAVRTLPLPRDIEGEQEGEGEVVDNSSSPSSSSSSPNPSPSPSLFIAQTSLARGLHVPVPGGVHMVLSPLPPRSPEEYLHLAGRTGRMDLQRGTSLADKQHMVGEVVTVVTLAEMKRMQAWQTNLAIKFIVLTGDEGGGGAEAEATVDSN